MRHECHVSVRLNLVSNQRVEGLSELGSGLSLVLLAAFEKTSSAWGTGGERAVWPTPDSRVSLDAALGPRGPGSQPPSRVAGCRLPPTARRTPPDHVGCRGSTSALTSGATGGRGRTSNVKAALCALRQLIPTEPRDRTLSKVETLRLAAGYIAHLAATRARLQGALGQSTPSPGSCRNGAAGSVGGPGSVCTFCVAENKRARATAAQGSESSPGTTSRI
ncbi:transcription factor 15-like [Ixodes scapularis]